MVKFGFAIAGGLSGVIMSTVGFDSGADVQPEGAVDGLRASFSGLPILGTLIAMYVMRDYDVTEETANKVREELDARYDALDQLTSYYQTGKLASLMATTADTHSKSDTDFSNMSTSEITALFTKTLHNGVHGMCFSPYAEGQNIGDQLSVSQIKRRMDIIAPHTKWVRSFSCSDGNELIPKVAYEKGLKTMAGAWIGRDKAKNNKEITRLIDLAKKGYVDIAVIGNEALMRGDVSEQEIIQYIHTFKKALPDIPVSYVDAYYKFHEHPELIEACDVILVNCYPFWEGASIEESSRYLRQMYAVTKSISNGKPVMITETGWPNQGKNTNNAVPSPENAMKYFIDTANWSQQDEVPLFYFSSFDESWKVHQEGDVGARWGLWNTEEKLKYK